MAEFDPNKLSQVKQDDVPQFDPEKFQKAKESNSQSVIDKLLGIGGPRYQLFPERAVRDIGAAIKQFIEAGAAGPPGSQEITEAAAGPSAEAALQFTPLGPETRIARAAIKTIPSERQSAVETLGRQGIDVTAGQARGSEPLRTAESALGTAPFSGDVASKQADKQLRQFTKAALAKVGEDADQATPEIIDRAFTRIGKEFDRLEQNTLLPDEQFKADIAKANQDYSNVTSLQSRVPYIQNLAEKVASLDVASSISGSQYKSLRSEMNRVMRKTMNPEYKSALQEYIDALDGAMERTLEKINPEELGRWREARKQYRNMLVIEKAIPAGEAGAAGLITPAKLRQAALSQDKRAFRRGQGEFAELANAGEQIMSPVKTSKTSERAMSLGEAGLGVSALAALASGNIPLAGKLLASMFGPGVAGRILMSPMLQARLKADLERRGRQIIPQELLYRGGINELLQQIGSQGGQNAPQ